MIIRRYAPNENLDSVRIGNEYKIRCFIPGHKDDTPSLCVSRDKFLYKCFGRCSAEKSSGDFLDLIQIVEHCSFIDAVKIACGMCGLIFGSYDSESLIYDDRIKERMPTTPPKKEIKIEKPKIKEDDAVAYHLNLLDHEKELIEFVKDRCLDIDTIREFKLGMDSKGNFTIPIYDNGKLVNIKYRNKLLSPPDDDIAKSKWKKYWSHWIIDENNNLITYGDQQLFGKEFLLNAKEDSRIIICAGEFDAIVINRYRDRGLIGITSTTGEGSWNESYNSLIKDHRCYICFDNDEAGRQAVVKFRKKCPYGKIINIGGYVGEKGDITDFFKEYNVDDFVELLDHQDHQKITVPLESGLNTDERLKLLASISDEELLEMNPAFHIDNDGTVYITAMFKKENVLEKTVGRGKSKEIVEEEYDSYEPLIISSNRGIWNIPRLDKEIQRDNPYAVKPFLKWIVKQEPEYAQKRWYGPTAKKFIATGELYSDVKKAFENIYFSIKRYSDFIRKTHRGLVALYILGSYFYEGFPSYPYLLLTGEKGCGKSTLGRAIANLSFNGDFMTNPSVAALARQIEETKGLIVIDEAENQSQRAQGREALGQILNSGYQRGSKRVICDIDNNNKRRAFDIYCPKVMTSIYGLNDVTQSRCITIRMRKIERAKKIDDPHKDSSLIEASCKMYEIMMGYAPSVLKSHREISEMMSFEYLGKAYEKDSSKLEVYGRERELYLPLLTMAHFLFKETGYDRPWNSLIEELHYISEERVEDAEDEPEQILVRSIIDVMEKENVNEREFNMYELVTGYKGQYVEDPGHRTEKWITKTINKMGWAKKTSQRIRKNVEIITYDNNGNKIVQIKKLKHFIITRDGLGIAPVHEEIDLPF